MSEVHLFLIWANASGYNDEIIADVSLHFKVLEIDHISWDEDYFSSNLTRFYGEKLPKWSRKEFECGTSRFTLIVVLDESPEYAERLTSKGKKIVNTKMFDAKSRYRLLTGGGHKIHCTNDVSETKHDILLLTHKTYDQFLQTSTLAYSTLNSERNLLGCVQWKSLSDLFSTLNETIDYVVLRNFEQMPDRYFEGDHGDIDILVRDKNEAVHILNANALFLWKFRVHYYLNIDFRAIRFDVRFVGDGYYDASWQEHILANRILVNGLYVPSPDDFKYSLLYHALIHKRSISQDYQQKLNQLGVDPEGGFIALNNFMNERHYKYTEPNDLSVYFNRENICSKQSFARYIYGVLRRLKKTGSQIGKSLYKGLRNVSRKILY